ncbi:MACF1 factor, partial [Atractosteus spatula]|nr:MACF1 factor [Atractosteus spatula]MBN3314438.1 MACF1 factor [Atractosteus spatula]
MSSSDEESLSERSCLSERSGSLSPCPPGPPGPPGDTLPWNLPRHQRHKRKSQDSVLDPAERAVVRVAGKSCPGAGAEGRRQTGLSATSAGERACSGVGAPVGGALLPGPCAAVLLGV